MEEGLERNFESLPLVRPLHWFDDRTLLDYLSNTKLSSAVEHDIKLVTEEELELFVQPRKHVLNLSEADDHHDARLWWLDYQLKRRLAAERLNLTAANSRPNGLSLQPNEEGLFDLASFTTDNKDFLSTYALPFNNRVYRLHPLVQQSNSGYWLTHKLRELESKGNKPFIRLDPIADEGIEGFQSYEMFSHYYGKPLDWEWLLSMPDRDFGAFWPDSALTRKHYKTNYLWERRGTELHLTLEEVPTVDEISEVGARYLHAILDVESRSVIHVDGAWRIYNRTEYSRRKEMELQSRDMGKEGIRRKIFRIDGDLNTKDLVDLCATFFYWNYDVTAYFGCERSKAIISI